MLKHVECLRIVGLIWLVCLTSGLLSTVRADVLPPGGKSVEHQLRFEKLADYPDHAFFLGWYMNFRKPDGEWKVRRLSDVGEISAQPPESPPYGAKMKLAVVPRSQADGSPPHGDPMWFEGTSPGVRLADIDVELIRFAPVTDRRSTFWTVYRVSLGDSLKLERTRHDVPTAAPQMPFAILTASAIAALAALVLMVIVGYRFVQEWNSATGFRR